MKVILPEEEIEQEIETPSNVVSMPLIMPESSIPKANAEVYRDTTPDQAAKNINVAKKLNVELPLVETDPKYFEDKANEPDYETLGPALNEYLTDMQNSSVSRDDTEALSQAEDIHAKHEEDGAFYRGIQAVVKATPRGFTTISEGLNNALGFGFGVLDQASSVVSNLTGLEKGEGFKATRDLFQGLASENRAILQGDKTIAGLNLGVSDVIKDKRLIENPDLLLSPEWMITQAGDAVAQFLPMIATAYFTGGSNLVAGAVGGLQEASSFYNDLITNEKATEDDALTGTLLFGMASTALNKIGIDAILAKQVVNSTIKRIGISAVKGGIEAGTEYFEELTQGVIQALSENGITDPEIATKVKDGFIESAKNIDVMVGAFMLGGGMSYSNTRIDYVKAKEAERYKEVISKMGDALENSKTKKRSPEQVEKFLTSLGFGTEGYLTSEGASVLFQNNPEIARKIGLTADAISESNAGLDIPVDTKKVISQLTPEEREFVINDLKPAPGALSQNEVNNIDIEKDLSEMVDRFAEATQNEEAFKTEIDRVKQETIDAGVQPEQAEKTVEILSKFANRMALEGKDRAETISKISFKRETLAEFKERNPDAFKDEKTFFQTGPDSIEGQIIQAENELRLRKKRLKGVRKQRRAKALKRIVGIEYATESQLEVAKSHVRMADLRVNELKQAKQEGSFTVIEPEIRFQSNVDQTETKAFKDWFGDSKVKNKDRSPKIVYHGTPTGGFDVFDKDKQGIRSTGKVDKSRAFHFTDDPETASAYSLEYLKSHEGVLLEALGYVPEHMKVPSGAMTYEVYLSLQNPAIVDKSKEITEELIKTAKAFGHDGIIAKMGKGTEYVVFEPNQIKSATDNIGTFDPKNPSILKQDKAGAVTITDEKYIVSLFEGANPSTLIHETGHIFLREMESTIKLGIASDSLTKDYSTVLQWLGAKEGEPLTVEQEEQFAKGFEAYLMDGKSPTKALESAFESFRKWLLAVYRSAVGLGVNLTPEIRTVFDNMLNAEAELAEASINNGMQMPTEKQLDAMNVDPKDREYMQRRLDSALKQAETALHKARMKNYSKKYKAWKQQAYDDYARLPGYVTFSQLRDGNGLNQAEMIENYGQEIVDQIPNSVPKVVRLQGQTLSQAAIKQGYDTVDDMVNAITSLPTRKQYIEGYIRSQGIKEDAKISVNDFLVGQSAYSDFLYMLAKYEKANSDQKIPTPKVFKEVAKKMFSKFAVSKATRISSFLSAIKKHSLAKTGRANEKVRLNHELARLSVKQREGVAKTLRKANSLFKADIKSEYKDQALRIIQRFGLSKRQIALEPNRPTISEFFTGLEKDLDIELREMLPIYSEMFMDDSRELDYRDLTVEEFTELDDLLSYLKKRGYKSKHKLLADGTTKVAEMVNVLVKPMLNLRKKKYKPTENTKVKEITDKTRKFFAAVESLPWIFKRADGYKTKTGPNEENLTNRLTDADNVWITLTKEYSDKLTPIFEHFQKRGKDFPKRIINSVPVPSVLTEYVNRTWTFERILAIALNRGNEINYSRIKAGYDLTDAQINTLLDNLNDKDWDMIQETWDIINSLKEPSFTIFQKINDFRPKEVSPTPFTTPSGREMRGGYYPLKYDPSLDSKIEEFTETEDLMNSTAAMFAHASPKQGSMKARKEGVVLPVKLDLGVLVGHVNDTIRYISHAEAINDINQITKHKTYREAMNEAEGIELHKEIRLALAAIARPGDFNMSQLDSWAVRESARSTAYILGLNASVALKQPYSIFGYVSDVGDANLFKGTAWGIKGLARVMQHPFTALEAMHQMSPYMKERSNRIDRDFGKKNFVSKTDKKWKAVQDAMFILIKTMDFVTVYPAWNGAYLKGMKENAGDKAKAIKYADSIIRHSQPSAQEIDMSRLQRDRKGMHRLWTMFSTFTFKAGQYQRYDYNKWKQGEYTHLQYLSTIAIKQIAPPIMMNLMFCAMWGDDPDPKELAIDTLMYQFLGVYIVREFVGFAGSVAKGEGWRTNPLDSPILTGGKLIGSLITGIIKAISDLGDDEKMEKALWTIAEFISYKAKVPVLKLVRNVKEGIRQSEEGEGTPMNILVRNPSKVRR